MRERERESLTHDKDYGDDDQHHRHHYCARAQYLFHHFVMRLQVHVIVVSRARA